MEDVQPTTKFARVYSLFILIVVVMSILLLLIESEPQFFNGNAALDGLDYFCLAVFTLDYFLRLATCLKIRSWAIQPLNVVDVLSFLPFYIELAVSVQLKNLGVVRVLRVLRVFRVLKLGKFSSSLNLVIAALKRSLDGFILLAFLLCFALIIFSTSMFYAEQSEGYFNSTSSEWIRVDGTLSPFQSIPATMWWCIVTLTTTGYGDTYPITPSGKAVACFCAICGLLVIAFPVTVLGTNFTDIYMEHKKKKKRRVN